MAKVFPSKIINLKVIGCSRLTSKVNKDLIPFFYYQFYTFDEHYSATLQGANPVFEDARSFEVKFDEKFREYC